MQLRLPWVCDIGAEEIRRHCMIGDGRERVHIATTDGARKPQELSGRCTDISMTIGILIPINRMIKNKMKEYILLLLVTKDN